jgi:hypothetical protein
VRSEIVTGAVAFQPGVREIETSAEEQAVRSSRFVEGHWIRLADGHAWSFPKRLSDPPDTEYDALLDSIASAEDWNEVLSGELALAIYLLARNYELSSDDYRRLLVFNADRESLVRMQTEFHAFASEQMRLLNEERTRRVR